MVAKISGEDFFRLLDCVVTHEMIDEMLNKHEKEVIDGEMLTGYQNVYNAICNFFNKTINLAEKVGFSAKSLIIQSPNDFSHIPSVDIKNLFSERNDGDNILGINMTEALFCLSNSEEILAKVREKIHQEFINVSSEQFIDLLLAKVESLLRKTANCLRNSIAELIFEAGIDDDIMLSLFKETSDLALVGLSVVLDVSPGDKVILSEEELRKIHESFDNEGKVIYTSEEECRKVCEVLGSKELYNVYILESEFDEIYNSYYKKVMAIRLLIEKFYPCYTCE